jgi:hypothetical protein
MGLVEHLDSDRQSRAERDTERHQRRRDVALRKDEQARAFLDMPMTCTLGTSVAASPRGRTTASVQKLPNDANRSGKVVFAIPEL